MGGPSCAMPRVDAIWFNPTYQRLFASLQEAEEQREFCRHDLQHFLDVARVCWIALLEDGARERLSISRDVVYAAALLHDIGRAVEYETGEDHDAAGARIAGEILEELDADVEFSLTERALIAYAVGAHRSRAAKTASDARASALAAALRFADKASRPCYACPARQRCNWPDEKINHRIAW